MKSPIKFDSVADRIAYKKREFAKYNKQRELIDEADASTAMLVFYGFPAFFLGLIILIILFAGGVR